MTTTKKTAATNVTETLEDAAAVQQKMIEDTVKADTETMSEGYEEAYKSTKEQMDKMNKLTFKNYYDLADLNKDTVEAMMVSSNVVAKGVEEMGKEITAYTQMAMDKNMEAAKKIFAVKNMQDLINMQAEWTKMAMDSYMDASAKLQDMSMQVGTNAAEPITKQVNAAVEKFVKPFAA